jgi:hypothetical protein
MQEVIYPLRNYYLHRIRSVDCMVQITLRNVPEWKRRREIDKNTHIITTIAGNGAGVGPRA